MYAFVFGDCDGGGDGGGGGNEDCEASGGVNDWIGDGWEEYNRSCRPISRRRCRN